jgi:hypothetical protein
MTKANHSTTRKRVLKKYSAHHKPLSKIKTTRKKLSSSNVNVNVNVNVSVTKRKSHFLKVACLDSKACLAVGKEIKKINQFFNHNDFTAVENIRTIGVSSDNGFIKEIKYSRDGYNAYAILKSAKHSDSDNLMYEYEVGQYINGRNKYFSCFLETYGLHMYKNSDAWRYFKDILEIDRERLLAGITAIPQIDYKKGCLKSKYIAILIQHINKAITFNQFILNGLNEVDLFKKEYALSFDVFYILYQIYFVLDILKNEFTHYDLHTNNVLLYGLNKDEYITYQYHLKSGQTVVFQSQYIAKIIDYGRCYYYEDAEKNSKKTYYKLCRLKECDPECGQKVGFDILGPEESPGSFNYISSQVRNKSHDLRLANIVKNKLKMVTDQTVSDWNKDILQRIIYEKKNGTPEKEDAPKDTYNLPSTINNVTDMRTLLEHLITRERFINHNNTHFISGFTKKGDIHIYENRQPMEFIKVEDSENSEN